MDKTNLLLFYKRLFSGILSRIMSFRNFSFSGPAYWEERVKKFGRRSVLNITHTEEEYDSVTAFQKTTLFPLLKSQLRGDENKVLDFGCGPGRFTEDLASLIGGHCIGIDPISKLLDIAPRSENTEYMLFEKGVIPVPDASVDVVWACLVLGCITSDKELKQTSNEIRRILKESGLLFVIENTTNRPDIDHYRYLSVQEYQKTFDFVRLEYLSDYYDVDERISIMAGRTKSPE